MAIYRAPKPRWRAAAAAGVVGLALGLALGLFLGSRGASPREAADEIRRSLIAAAGGLEVLVVEYRESVSSGRVVQDSEFRGARDALARSRASYSEVAAALRAIDPPLAGQIDGSYERLEGLVDERAEPDEVEGAAGELEALLKGDAGPQ